MPEAINAAFNSEMCAKRKEAVVHLLSLEYDFGASWEDIKKEIAEDRYRATMKSVYGGEQH